jgi:hypothetical protein
MTIKQLVTKMAVGVALTGALALSLPTASFAFGGHQYYYEPSNGGSVWSYYPGYFSHGPADGTMQRPAAAHARASAATNHECWISARTDETPGLGYWGACSTPGAVPMK